MYYHFSKSVLDKMGSSSSVHCAPQSNIQQTKTTKEKFSPTPVFVRQNSGNTNGSKQHAQVKDSASVFLINDSNIPSNARVTRGPCFSRRVLRGRCCRGGRVSWRSGGGGAVGMLQCVREGRCRGRCSFTNRLSVYRQRLCCVVEHLSN